MKRDNKIKYMGIILSVFVLSFLFLFIITPKQTFSENENRVLEKFPMLSIDSILDGTFIENLENYTTDHFPFRDMFMNIHSTIERWLGKTIINGVYIGSDDTLIEEYKKPQKTDLFIQTLNSFYDRNNYINTNLMLVPTSITINKDKLPNNASSYSQLEVLEYIKKNIIFSTIDIVDTLKENNKTYPMYYRLDHHWTSYGAYYAYIEFCKQNSLEYLPISEYSIDEVTKEFNGTLYSKASLYSLKSDSIHVFKPKNGENLKVEYIVGDKITTKDSLYEYSYLDKKDKYSLFLNNNQPLIKITNNNINNGKKLLVIKDSYANSLIPFLTYNFNEIHVIDPRYYKASITEYTKNNNITDTLFVYNMNTLDTDTGIYSIK